MGSLGIVVIMANPAAILLGDRSGGSDRSGPGSTGREYGGNDVDLFREQAVLTGAPGDKVARLGSGRPVHDWP